eukprot:1584799-Rhodomonas_salina.1
MAGLTQSSVSICRRLNITLKLLVQYHLTKCPVYANRKLPNLSRDHVVLQLLFSHLDLQSHLTEKRCPGVIVDAFFALSVPNSEQQESGLPSFPRTQIFPRNCPPPATNPLPCHQPLVRRTKSASILIHRIAPKASDGCNGEFRERTKGNRALLFWYVTGEFAITCKRAYFARRG